MENQNRPDRRTFLKGLSLGLMSLSLSGCDYLSGNKTFTRLLEKGEKLNRKIQKAISPRAAMAKEYSETDISPVFPVNGNSNPESPDYQRHLREGFKNWRLPVRGLVDNPLSLSIDEIRQYPSRTQITRLDCVEGWSAIGKWKGVKLGELLDRAKLRPGARYVIFNCADSDEEGITYYESIDLEDAFEPEYVTIPGKEKTVADLKAASLRRSFSSGTARCVLHTMASWLSGSSTWGRTSWRTIL